MEQISKTREGNKVIRRHAKRNRTPAQRLLDGGEISAKQKSWIESQLAVTNPFQMKNEIEKDLREIWELVEKLDREGSQEWESDLAEAGPPPLRSGNPASAREKPKNQAAKVSS